METGVVLIQEPVSTKKSVEEASAGVISTEKVDTVNMSTVLDDEIIKVDVTEVVTGSGDKETEESEREKGESTKTIFVLQDNKIDKEEDSVIKKDDQDTEEAKMILRDVTLEKGKYDDITQNSEEVIFEKLVAEEDQTETKHSADQDKEINKVPKPLGNISTKTRDDENQPKGETDEVKDLACVETSVNEKTEAEHTATAPEEGISRSFVNEDDPEVEKAETVDTVKCIDDAVHISHEVTGGDTEKEEDTTPKVQESPLVIEKPKVQGENIESKASKGTEEHEHVTEAEAVNTSTVQGSVAQPVIEDDHAETKHSEELSTISKAREEVPIKTDEVKEERDSETVETFVNESEAEHKATAPVKQILTNREKVTAPEEETATHGEPVYDAVTTERILEAKEDAETKFDAKEKDKTETVKEVIEDREIVNNEEPTIHESESLKENAEETKASKTIDDAEREGDVDREKEEDLTPKAEEAGEEDNESKASLDHEEEEANKSSNKTKEDEHVLVRDMPLVTEAETEDNLKTLEIKQDTEASLDLREETETVVSPDGVRSSNLQVEEFGEPCNSEINEESHRREAAVEVKSKETVQDEITNENLVDVPSTKLEKHADKVPEAAQVSSTEIREKCEEISLDRTLKDDGTQSTEKQKGLDLNEPEAEKTDQNRMDETEQSSDVNSVEQKPSLETPSETRKTVDEKKIEEVPEEDATRHQEGQEEGSYDTETKQETDSRPKSSELGEKPREERSLIPQVESLLPNEQKKKTELQRDEIDVSSAPPSTELEGETVVEAKKVENIRANEEEQAAGKIQERVKTVEIAEPRSSLPSSSEKQEHGAVSEKLQDEEPIVHISSVDDATKNNEGQDGFSKTTVVEVEQTRDVGPSLAETCCEDKTQAKFTSTERGETKANESEKDKPDEHVDSPTTPVWSDEKDNEILSAEAKKGDEEITVRDMPQDETIIANVAADTSTMQEAATSKTLKTKIIESEAMHSQVGTEEESQETKEDTERNLEVKSSDVKAKEFGEGQRREESVEAQPKEIVQDESTKEKDKNLLDEQSGESSETMQKTSSFGLSEETSKTVDMTSEEKVTLNQEEGSYVLDTVSVPENRELGEKPQEEISCLPKHEEVPKDQQSPAEEKCGVAEKIEVREVKEAEPTGEMSEKAHDIAETTDMSLPSVCHAKYIKALHEEIQVASTDPSPMYPEKNDKESLTVEEVEKGDEEITLGSKISENVCTKQQEFDKLDPPKIEESKEDTSEEISETTTATQAERVEDVKEEERSKLEAEEILPTEIITRESSSPVSMLSTEEVTLQEGHYEGDTQAVPPVSTKPKECVDETRSEHVKSPTSSKKNDNDTLTAEAKKRDEATSELETTGENVCEQEEFGNPEPPKLEESKEDKSPEILTATEAIEAPGDQILPIQTSQPNQTLASEIVPRKVETTEDNFEATGDQSLPVETLQEDQTPSIDDQPLKKVEIFHEGENVARKLQVDTVQADQTPSFVTELEDQIPKQIEEFYQMETKEADNLQGAANQILPVATSQAEQTPPLVSEQDDQTSKQVEELHKEDTKEAQAKEVRTETIPGESFSEAPTLQEGGSCGGDRQDERHVSAEAEAEGREKANDQVETSNGRSISNTPELKDVGGLQKSTGEEEHEDESSSNLPVVEILKGLRTGLESEGEIRDPASCRETMPTEKVQKISDAEVVSNEKDSVANTIEANMLQQNESGEIRKIEEENGLAGKSLPVKEVNLQEENEEEVKKLDREFHVNVKEKLQEDETREISEKQEEHKAQEDANSSAAEKISVQVEHPRDLEISKKVGDSSDQVIESELIADQPPTQQKTEIQEIVNIKKEKKSEEVQDENFEGVCAIKDTEDTFSSGVNKDKKNASELGVGYDFTSPQVEKKEEPQSVLGIDEEINEVVFLEKQTTDEVVVIKKAEHESNEEHVEPQTKSQREEVHVDQSLIKEALDEQIQVSSSAVPDDQDLSVKQHSELIQSHQSPNQVEETTFEHVNKAREERNEDTSDALIKKENVRVEDESKIFEGPAKDKETSEQEPKSEELTYVPEDTIRGDGDASVVAQKEETGFIEKKGEVEYVKKEVEDAVKIGVSVEEKNNAFEKTDCEASKEIYQKENKRIDTVTCINQKEELSGGSQEILAEKKSEETDKETTQECFNSMKYTNDATEKTKPEIREIENLSSDTSKSEKKAIEDMQQEGLLNQQKREIADEVPKMENLKVTEELRQRDGESENTKVFSLEVKDSEPKVKEPARKSLSDHIQIVKGTNKTEEEEEEEHKHDKTSPDSIVMVEAKDTIDVIKTHHKKSHGILSGVGSKVKHSISKVKKALTGKSSHTTKPSSPK